MSNVVSTGTYNFALTGSDAVIEAFERIQIRASSLTREHTRNAYLSANLLLQEWSIRPAWPNLWKIELLSFPLVQGVPTYAVPTNVVMILDAYLREQQTGNPINLSNAFSTVSGQSAVSIALNNNSLVPGNPVIVVCPVSVGGLVLQGQYPVASVISPNLFTIDAGANATSTVNNGGVVPAFTTALGSPIVIVSLPNHDLATGEAFSVQIPTLVGGLTLTGIYTVASIIDANTFTFNAGVAATGPATVSENGGLAQIETQPNNSTLIDFVVTPISRTEYADQPNKLMQARPTTFWWDRLINSQITTWPVADQEGLYIFYYYAMTQIQDFSSIGGTGLDLPARFFEAFCAGLAEKLAWKYPPPMQSGITLPMLKSRADEAWDWASRQDSEQNIPLFLVPGMQGYYRQ